MIYDESENCAKYKFIPGKISKLGAKILLSFESDKHEKNWQNECESCSVAQFSETSTLTQADAEIGVVWSK